MNKTEAHMNRYWYSLFITLLIYTLSSTVTSYSQTSANDYPAVTVSSVTAPQFVHGYVSDDDSLQQELRKLESELERLGKELDALEGDNEELIQSFETQIRDVEERIKTIETQLQSESEFEDEWDFEEAGTESDEDEWEWEKDFESDFEDWSSIESEFFRKFPAIFNWDFPMGSTFASTFIRYNRVEGFYIGLARTKRLNWHSQKRIVSTFSLGYGFASKRGRYSAGLYFPFYLNDQIIEIGGEGYLLTDSKDQWTMDLEENSLMAFFAKEDFMDYFQRGGYNVGASWYYRTGNDETFRVSAKYIHDTYKEMGKETNWSLFGGDKQFRENPIMNNMSYDRFIAGNLNSLMFAAGFSTTASDSRSEGWKATLSYETAGGFAKGDYEFDQLLFDARRYQPLGDYLQWNTRIRYGGSDGNVPFQRVFDMGGIGTLPGYRFKAFSGTYMGLLNTELILKSDIADISAGWFKRIMQSFNIILFYDLGAVAYTTPNDVTTQVLEVTPPTGTGVFEGISELQDLQWKNSVGIAVGSSDGSYRIGIAWPMNGDKKPSLVLRLASPF